MPTSTAPTQAALTQWTIADVYQFCRFSALSFSLMVPLLGAAVANPRVSWTMLAMLSAVGVSFHLFAYLLNDVIDLPIDRTEPLRAASPLVRGLISSHATLTLALLQVPVLLALGVWVGANPRSLASLALALLLMSAYNLWGKRIGVPFVADFIQGISWAALALFPAFSFEEEISPATAIALALVFLAVLLINGVHGGLRDLANDAHCGARTTAILLGAKSGIVPAPLILYALALQTVGLAVTLTCLRANWLGYTTMESSATALLVLATHGVLLLIMNGARKPELARGDLTRLGLWHLVLSLALLYLPFALFFAWPARLVLLAAYVIPVAVMIRQYGVRWE